MAQSETARPQVGKILTQDEKDSLLEWHIKRIRDHEPVVEAAKLPVKEAKEDLTSAQEEHTKLFNAAKVDLGRGYTREYMQSLINDSRTKARDLVEIETRRAHDKQVLGQPVFGAQPELFPGSETPQETKDELAWEAEGYMLGRRGALKEVPEGCPERFVQSVLLAYGKGQEETQRRYLAGQEVIDRRANPDAGAEAVDLSAKEPADEDADLDDAAAKLKRSGFMERGEGANDAGDGFEASAEELAAQAPRAAAKDAKAGDDSSASAAA